ncbi:SPRY domain-containing protein 7 [Bulinus truncatus]|nr:SPRY domain-containing protein 7 [Bulinus truncatus]
MFHVIQQEDEDGKTNRFIFVFGFNAFSEESAEQERQSSLEENYSFVNGVVKSSLATRRCNLNKLPLGSDADSWVLRQDGCMFHSGEEKGKLPDIPQEGDILGLTYDHIELNFFLNGNPVNVPFNGIKGTVYPVFYVDEGAVIDVQFDKFYHSPPNGFDPIMIEQSLL